MARQVAIVGAGAAGAATATALADVADVTVFEKHDAVGGRSRTCERGACCYETGANYLTPTDDRVAKLVEDAVPADAIVELDGDVWTFDEDGTIAEGKDADGDDTDGDDADGGGVGSGDANSEDGDRDRRITCESGLSALSEHLLSDAGVEVVLETKIDALARTNGDWRLRDGEGSDRGTFDAVVLTPPSPLAADLLGRSEWPHADCREVREAIESVAYRPIASVVMHYPFELDRPWYALVNDDREHPIGWIAREDRKPGHVPDGESVLLVQCSSEFTIDNYDADPLEVVDKVGALTAGLLADDRLTDPDWSDFNCWRYGAPKEGVEQDRLSVAAEHDLYVAGDWVAGEDRLNGALRSGLATGETVRDDLF